MNTLAKVTCKIIKVIWLAVDSNCLYANSLTKRGQIPLLKLLCPFQHLIIYKYQRVVIHLAVFIYNWTGKTSTLTVNDLQPIQLIKPVSAYILVNMGTRHCCQASVVLGTVVYLPLLQHSVLQCWSLCQLSWVNVVFTRRGSSVFHRTTQDKVRQDEPLLSCNTKICSVCSSQAAIKRKTIYIDLAKVQAMAKGNRYRSWCELQQVNIRRHGCRRRATGAG